MLVATKACRIPVWQDEQNGEVVPVDTFVIFFDANGLPFLGRITKKQKNFVINQGTGERVELKDIVGFSFVDEVATPLEPLGEPEFEEPQVDAEGKFCQEFDMRFMGEEFNETQTNRVFDWLKNYLQKLGDIGFEGTALFEPPTAKIFGRKGITAPGTSVVSEGFWDNLVKSAAALPTVSVCPVCHTDMNPRRENLERYVANNTIRVRRVYANYSRETQDHFVVRCAHCTFTTAPTLTNREALVFWNLNAMIADSPVAQRLLVQLAQGIVGSEEAIVRNIEDAIGDTFCPYAPQGDMMDFPAACRVANSVMFLTEYLAGHPQTSEYAQFAARREIMWCLVHTMEGYTSTTVRSFTNKLPVLSPTFIQDCIDNFEGENELENCVLIRQLLATIQLVARGLVPNNAGQIRIESGVDPLQQLVMFLVKQTLYRTENDAERNHIYSALSFRGIVFSDAAENECWSHYQQSRERGLVGPQGWTEVAEAAYMHLRRNVATMGVGQQANFANKLRVVINFVKTPFHWLDSADGAHQCFRAGDKLVDMPRGVQDLAVLLCSQGCLSAQVWHGVFNILNTAGVISGPIVKNMAMNRAGQLLGKVLDWELVDMPIPETTPENPIDWANCQWLEFLVNCMIAWRGLWSRRGLGTNETIVVGHLENAVAQALSHHLVTTPQSAGSPAALVSSITGILSEPGYADSINPAQREEIRRRVASQMALLRLDFVRR